VTFTFDFLTTPARCRLIALDAVLLGSVDTFKNQNPDVLEHPGPDLALDLRRLRLLTALSPSSK